MEHGTLLKSQALPLLVIVGLTTPVVYLVTGWTVQLMLRLPERGEEIMDAMLSSPFFGLALSAAAWCAGLYGCKKTRMGAV
ncbi:MAG: hypothetical protein ACLRWQ_00165 [Flavonifractor plautii]